MKRNFILVCVSALVLALGLSASAGAGVNAEVSAKPAKKGKSCKKKGGKKKAGKSTAATAQAKKKGKKKSCKAKSKPKHKGEEKTPPAPTPPAAAPFGDGTFQDPTARLELNVSGGATTIALKYVPPGGCLTINYTSQPVTLTKNGDTWAASETGTVTLGGFPANVKWDLAVKEPGFTYALNLTLESNPPVVGPCKWEGHPTGTLVKVG